MNRYLVWHLKNILNYWSRFEFNGAWCQANVGQFDPCPQLIQIIETRELVRAAGYNDA